MYRKPSHAGGLPVCFWHLLDRTEQIATLQERYGLGKKFKLIQILGVILLVAGCVLEKPAS